MVGLAVLSYVVVVSLILVANYLSAQNRHYGDMKALERIKEDSEK